MIPFPPLLSSESNLLATPIDIRFSNWYNPSLNYHLLMAPGVLAILVTLVGGFLSALNIVREKEMGTIEQINVTPIKKHRLILGKLSMPPWAQVIAALNPVTYFLEVMRIVILKGSTLKNVLPQLGIIASFALVLNLLAMINYKKMN